MTRSIIKQGLMMNGHVSMCWSISRMVRRDRGDDSRDVQVQHPHKRDDAKGINVAYRNQMVEIVQ
jgi:hypothetical protein